MKYDEDRVPANRQQALDDIEIGWPHQFQTGQITERKLKSKTLDWLLVRLNMVFPTSHTARADYLKSIANVVEADGPIAGYDIETCRQLAQQLRNAAGRQLEANAAWNRLVARDELTSQQRRILDALWRHNEIQATTWKVPFDDFVKDVWANPATHPKTIASAITNLTAALLEKGMKVEFSIRQKAVEPHVECTIFD